MSENTLHIDRYVHIDIFIKSSYLTFLTDGLAALTSPFVLSFSTAKKHRNASVEHPAAEASWVGRTELVFGQLEGR